MGSDHTNPLTQDTRERCPDPSVIDAIAHGKPPTQDEEAHIARCKDCASAISLSRFTNRFSNVMTGHPVEDLGPSGMPNVFGYRCVDEVARGGQGVVYRAVQETTGRMVAIKVLHPDASGRSRRAQDRMAREIEMASLLDHPGIVRIVDSLKLADGRDALVMELIEGKPLNDWFADHPRLSERHRLEMLAWIADAIHHAHQLGVIHRDLKPSNILVDTKGFPRVLDFGVARKTVPGEHDPRITASGEFAGTIAYAAPEEVSDGSDHVDVRTDVYALGVIGFEVLTGAPPYSVDGPIQGVIDRILHSEVSSSLRSDNSLDAWTVLTKAMSKDKSRRYQSAAELAEDLRRAATGEGIHARADSRWYVLRKTARRHRVPLSLLGILMLGVAATSISLAIGNARLNRAIDESRLLQIRALLAAGNRERAETVFWEEIDSDLSQQLDPRVSAWLGAARDKQLMWCFVEMQSDALCLRVLPNAVSPRYGLWSIASGGFLAVSNEGRLIELDASGDPVADQTTWQMPPSVEMMIATPDGQVLMCYNNTEVWTLDRHDGHRIASWAHDGNLRPHAVRNWGIAVSTAPDQISVLSIPDLKPLIELKDLDQSQTSWLDASERVIAYAGNDNRLTVFDIDRGTEIPPSGVLVHEIERVIGPIQLLMSPRRDSLLVVVNGSIVVRDLESELDASVFERPGYRVSVHHDPLWSVVSAIAQGDPSLHLWATDEWRSLGALPGHQGSVYSHAFTPDGAGVLTIDETGTLRVWATPLESWRRAVGSPSASIHQFGVVPVTGEVVSPQSEQASTILSTRSAVTKATVSDNGRYAAFADLEGNIAIGNRQEGGSTHQIACDDYIAGLRFRPRSDSGMLGVCTGRSEFLLIDPETGEVLRQRTLSEDLVASDLAWSPDGSIAAISFRNGKVMLVGDDGVTSTHQISQNQIRDLTFLPDGQSIAAIGDSGHLILLNIKSGRVRMSEQLSERSLFSLAVHRSGGVCMVGDREGTVRVIETQTLREVASFRAGGAVMSLEFVPDEDKLVVAALDRPVEVWDFTQILDSFNDIRPIGH